MQGYVWQEVKVRRGGHPRGIAVLKRHLLLGPDGVEMPLVGGQRGVPPCAWGFLSWAGRPDCALGARLAGDLVNPQAAEAETAQDTMPCFLPFG